MTTQAPAGDPPALHCPDFAHRPSANTRDDIGELHVLVVTAGRGLEHEEAVRRTIVRHEILPTIAF
jgi:hypothetical protein